MTAPRPQTARRFGRPYLRERLALLRGKVALGAGWLLSHTNGPRNPDRIIKGVVQAATLGCRIDGASLPGISVVPNQERRPLAR
jgi:hypothetical protein